jgi:COP9 signalosome complex subunit 5
MGLLLGRPDPYCPTALVVTDAFPLPIEGFETRVVADDQDVVNHMIALNECLERSRNERFMGWYHSHPFDLSEQSHCFLSQTDLSTQLQWQRAEDPHGNPFVAIVLDPLRSHHLGVPQLKAFRAYPPEYQSSVPNQCPDGSVVSSEKDRLERWGSCWNRYYELSIEYHMSAASRAVLDSLTSDYLWMASLRRKDPAQTVRELQTIAKSANSAAGRAAAVTVTAVAGDAATSTTNTTTTPTTTASGRDFTPTVRQLQSLTTGELGQATLRHVQRRVFRTPASDVLAAAARADREEGSGPAAAAAAATTDGP